MRRAQDTLKSAFDPLIELQRSIAEDHNRLASRPNMAPSTLPHVPEDAVRFQHPSALPQGRESIPGMLSPWEMEPMPRPRCRAKSAPENKVGTTRPKEGVAPGGDSGWQGESSARGATGRVDASRGADASQQAFSSKKPEGTQPAAVAGYFAAASTAPHPGYFRPLQIEVLECS